MREELKSCPFCGAIASDTKTPILCWRIIHLDTCFIKFLVGKEQCITYTERDAWNRRTPDAK